MCYEEDLVVMCSEDAEAETNSVDPDQTTPVVAVSSGSTLFAQMYSLRFLVLLLQEQAQ